MTVQDSNSGKASLLLPDGRVADTPLEVIGCLLRQSLSARGHDADIQRALDMVVGIDQYTATVSTPVSQAVARQVDATMKVDWDCLYEAVREAKEMNLERDRMLMVNLTDDLFQGKTTFRQTANCCAGSFEAAFVSSMAQATRAVRVLEIGSFTGTTTMAVAEALPEGGKVYTLEIEPYLRQMCQDAFDAAKLTHKIEILLGDANESLAKLAQEGLAFDLIFIDADKTGYKRYFDTIMEQGLLAPSGTLLVDNTLFKGRFLVNQPVEDESSEALRVFNEHVLNDSRVNVVVLPIRDGVSMITRRRSRAPAAADAVARDGLDVLQRLSLGGKVALVTGAGQGIGRAFAHALGEAGAAVAVVDISQTTARAVADELKLKGIRSIALVADVTKRADSDRMVQDTITKWGHLDIAINNAGVNFNSAAEDITDAQWDTTFAVNTKGVLYCCQAEAKHMLESRRPCSIINTASMATLLVPHPQKQAAYNASKAAVVKLTESLAVEWAERGIRVNAISPGIVNTALITENPDLKPLVKTWLSQIPLGRLAEVTDLQAAVVYLASDASAYMTGQNIGIEGGQSII
ncbi:hypothetical protein HKX48_002138 [Thoreauomyces humboldtii]|nr:hypothetical protein HKX48_002138 [Thoreauomyces humboldtii]